MEHRNRKKTTLSGQLLLAILAIVMLISGLTSLGSYLLISQNARIQIETMANEHLETLSRSLELPLWTLDKNLINAIALSYLQDEMITAIRITESDEEKEIFSQRTSETTDYLQRSTDIHYKGQLLGRVSLAVNNTLLRHQLTSLVRYTLLSSLLMIVVLSLLTGYLLRRFLRRPLLTLQQGISRLATGEDTDDLQVNAQELQPIAQAFSLMARQIRERESELKQLTEASWEAILVHDQGVFLHANQQFFTLFEYLHDQIVGRPCMEKIVAPSHCENVLDRIKHNDLGPFETLGITATGDEFPMEVRARLIDYKGRTLRMVAIRDLRQRKHLEELMIQSEKMISVGGLAAGMAHEINNPLAGILQNTQVIRNRLNPELQKNLEVAKEIGVDLSKMNSYLTARGLLNMLENISTCGQRAAKIVNNILSFSRKSESLLLLTDMTALIDEALRMAENDYDPNKMIDFRRIEIIQQFEPALPLIPCEASQIQQVLLNLLKNGAYAMNEAKTEKPRFTLRGVKEDPWLKLEIEDNGPGMDEETRKRIFEPFYTTKGIGKGTGLGLSVSYFIITQTHQGQMTVQSSTGGTLFTIRLPLNQIEPNDKFMNSTA